MNIKNNKILYPVIVFDLGGVLMDWNPYYLYCDTLGLAKDDVDRFLSDVDFYNWNIEQDRGRSFEEATIELSSRFPEYRDLIFAYDKKYIYSVKGSFQPVVDILEKIKSADYPLYALSNWPAEKFHQVRPEYPFFDWFDGLVISGEVGLIKPDPAIFQLMLEKINRPASDCLLIDDHAPNIEVANEMGFNTIHFVSAPQLINDLIEMGILVE